MTDWEVEEVEEIKEQPYRSPGHEKDLRPTVTSRDGWGIWSGLEGKTLEENTFKNMRIEGPRRHIWSSHNLSDQLTTFHKENLLVYGNATWDGPLWASRLYNVSAATIKDCVYHSIGNFQGTGQWEGHAEYPNLFGDLTIDTVFMHTLLGQGLQIVWRETETKIKEKPRGEINIKKLRIRDAAMHPDRGSYPISVFNTGHSVNGHRISVWSTPKTPEWHNTRTGDTNRSRGGIFLGGGGTGTLNLHRVNVGLIDPDRPGVKLENWTDVKWDSGLLLATGKLDRRLRIQVDYCPRGEIINLDGDFEIYHDGKRVAVNEDYQW